MQVEQINVPYPDADSARLEIVVGAAGRVNVKDGAGEAFVEGTIEYDVPEWVPRIHLQDNTVRLVQDPRFWKRLHPDPVNMWDLRLGDEKSFSIDLKSGVSMGRWDLGRLPITGLNIETGVSNNVITFDGPNPEVLKSFKLTAGAGDVRLEGLLDANFEQMKLRGGVGEVVLRYTGEKLSRDARVTMDGGVGSFRIIVDETVPARATVKGLASVSTRDRFRRLRGGFPSGGEYRNDAYESVTGPRLEFNIAMGIGSITLDTC